MQKFLSIIVVLSLMLSMPVYAAETTHTSRLPSNKDVSTYSTTILDYAGNFTCSYSTTITVPYTSNITLIYGATLVSGSYYDMEIKIGVPNKEPLNYYSTYKANSGGKVAHITLPAGTYNVQLLGGSSVYRGAINMYIP